MDKEFLELFYSGVPKYFFAFQLNNIHKFNNEMLKLYYKSLINTKIFTSNNINDEKELSILENIFDNNI